MYVTFIFCSFSYCSYEIHPRTAQKVNRKKIVPSISIVLISFPIFAGSFYLQSTVHMFDKDILLQDSDVLEH